MNNNYEPNPAERPVSNIAKPLLSGPKRQHFLPEFYLEGFTRNGKLAVYDRKTNSVRVQQPINTGVIGHFYTFEDAEGRKRFEIEQMLSDFESKAKIAIENLAKKLDVSANERSDLAIFIALGGFRTPDIVESLKVTTNKFLNGIAKDVFADPEQLKEKMRGKPWAPDSDAELLLEANAMIDLVQKSEVELVTNHQWAIKMAMQMAFSVAPILASRNWIMLHRGNEKKSFITSDSPVLLTTTERKEDSFWGVGFGNSDALVASPLSQSCAVVMFGKDGSLEHKTASDDQIRHLNLGITDRCQRFVIGRDERLVQSLAKNCNLSSKEWTSKIQTSYA